MTIAKDKITEIFCMADDFCHAYERFIKVDGLAYKTEEQYEGTDYVRCCQSPPSQGALIETINDELKNMHKASIPDAGL